VIENMFPAQMNVVSVTQYGFLAWYLLNSNWGLVRSLMVVQLQKRRVEMDDGVAAMLEREPGRDDGESVEETAARLLKSSDLNKPDKPNSNRWGTQARMILFVARFSLLLAVVFDEMREYGSAGAAKPASIESMASQWIKWSGSPKLHAMLAMAKEFLRNWQWHDNQISLPGEDLETHCYHKVFSRPQRALSLLMDIERVAESYSNLESYKLMQAAYPGEREEVNALYVQMYSMALDCVKRNHARYLSGVYAYAGFGDACAASYVWEAFSHLKNHKHKPGVRTPRGKAIEHWLREGMANGDVSGAHLSIFNKLTNAQHLDDAYKLVKPLLKGVKEPTEAERLAFVESIHTADNLVAKQLRMWIPALSSTQPVEKTFLDYDNSVSKNGGGKKGKKSAPTGKEPQLDLTTAKVRVAQESGKIDRELLANFNEREKSELKKLQSARHVMQAMKDKLSRLQASPEEVKKAQKKVRVAQDRAKRSRGRSQSQTRIVSGDWRRITTASGSSRHARRWRSCCRRAQIWRWTLPARATLQNCVRDANPRKERRGKC
jgi:hypothetical protein